MLLHSDVMLGDHSRSRHHHGRWFVTYTVPLQVNFHHEAPTTAAKRSLGDSKGRCCSVNLDPTNCAVYGYDAERKELSRHMPI